MINYNVLRLEIDIDSVWTNVLGPTHEIRIVRQGFDLGTLTATVLDSVVDPTVATSIRPGRSVRLQALISSVWTTIYAGRLNKISVTYVGGTRVSLEAVDDVARLANQGEPDGVAEISDLPWLLAGKGVVWNVNGSSATVAEPPIVTVNENASVYDQVVLTRDSNLGYAWVDRTNVVNVWDAASLSTSVKAAFSDASGFSYTDIDISFDSQNTINDVTINWLKPGETGQTESVTYGPFKDASSISTWGPFSAQYTVHGMTSEAEISAYAGAILAANATPTIRVNSLRTPIRTQSEVNGLANLDLYDYVTVTHDGTTYTNTRITRVEHEITPESWSMVLGFEKHGVAAAPIETSSPPRVPQPPSPNGTDGLPPATAPTPVIEPGIKTLIVTWDPIANPDPVTYHVYVSATSPVVADSTTLYGSVQGTVMGIGSLANGDPLVAGTAYYVRIATEDADGAGPVGSEASGIPLLIDLDQLEQDIQDELALIPTIQTTADGKNKSFYQASAPTASAAGDLWFDTDDNNKIYRWSGSSWVAVPLGATAVSNLDAGSITTGTLSANRIGATSITATHLAAGSVLTDKIGAAQVTADKIAANAITADKIVANAITSDKIAANSITAGKLAAGAIDGITITGSLFRTAASGQRMEIRGYGTLSSANEILFYSGLAYETQPGYILSEANGTNTAAVPYMSIGSPRANGTHTWINLVGRSYSGGTAAYLQSGGGRWTHLSDMTINGSATVGGTLQVNSGINASSAITSSSYMSASEVYSSGTVYGSYSGGGSARLSTSGSDYWPIFWGYRGGGYGSVTCRVKLTQTQVQIRDTGDNFYAQIRASDFTTTSFTRFKESIRPVFEREILAPVHEAVETDHAPIETERPRDIVARNGIHKWVNLPDRPENVQPDDEPQEGVGLLADTMPEWMITEDGYSMNAVVGFLWEALKEANARLDALEGNSE